MKLNIKQLRQLIREEIEKVDYSQTMENNDLYHEKILSLEDIKRLVPNAVDGALKLELDAFWLNDVKYCSGDPSCITQGSRQFALAGGHYYMDEYDQIVTTPDGEKEFADAFMWVPDEGVWEHIGW